MRFSLLPALVLLTGSAFAACPPSYVITAGHTFDRPGPAFTKLEVVNTATNTPVRAIQMQANGSWVASTDDVAALRTLAEEHGLTRLRLRWSGGAEPCDVPFTFAARSQGSAES